MNGSQTWSLRLLKAANIKWGFMYLSLKVWAPFLFNVFQGG
jgi:hypothetical protein